MKNDSSRTFIGIIVVIILVMGFLVYRTDNNRLKLLEEYNNKVSVIENLYQIISDIKWQAKKGLEEDPEGYMLFTLEEIDSLCYSAEEIYKGET